MRGKSCTKQLISFLDIVGKNLDQEEQVVVVYLDMTKAFATVNHELRIEKIRNNGLNNNLLVWFKSFLHHRYQEVTILVSTSSPSTVTSSVPQGCILGPVLFLLYVNDLADGISSSSIATFADETKLFSSISSQNDSNQLQDDLDILSQWSFS